MNPLLMQIIALLVLLFAMMLVALTGFLLWHHHRDVAEQDRQRDARRQWLAARWPRRFPPSFTRPRR
jgi:cell division protein FtsL